MSEYRALVRRWAVAVAVGVSAVALTACESGSSEPTSTAGGHARTSATTASAPTIPGGAGDQPIGSAGVDLGEGASATTSYPPSMLSEDLADDCHLGGDRLYDRFGITCQDARGVLEKYEAAAAHSPGEEKTISRYQCSHNPAIMVNQGAAPGKCVDSHGNVVFNWRYPGAPQPAQG